ncbi:glycosyltransferase [Candidatus Saccharibacteria bacterium]|nr:glycosyltransferase [Candidatus Saccharibacteria bacterium]
MTPSSKNKTVSVILPNYNYAKYISSRIDQILNQTYPVSEIIILDDASTDDSVDEIKDALVKIRDSHPEIKIKVLVNKVNSGNVFSQWQKGIRLATSDFIWIAELDDVAKPNFLKTAVSAFIEKSVVLSCVGSKFIDEKGHPVLKDNLRKIKDAFRKNILVFNTIPNVSAVVFKNQPNLDEFLEEAKKYHLSGDWFFYIKISETGKISYIKKTLNLHRLHSGSVTKTTDLSERFSEMRKIHSYVLSHHRLADNETKKQIERLESSLKNRWLDTDR